MVLASIILIAIIFAVLIILKSYVRLNLNEEAIVERKGRFHRVLGEGHHFIIPVFEALRGLAFPEIESSGKKILLSSQIMRFPNDNRAFYTKNNNRIKIKSSLSYKIEDSYKAVYAVDYLFDAINQLVSGIVQNRLVDIDDGNIDDEIKILKELFKKLPEISNEHSKNWGVKIIKVEPQQIIDTNGLRYEIKD